MEKCELGAFLELDGAAPDTDPIEEYLHLLATSRGLPDLAVAVCIARVEEAAPILRAMLVRAADGETLTEDEKMLAFRGLYILGGARDSAACQPLLRLLRRPEEELDDLLGDAITESLAKIVASVFDGDVDALFSAIADRSLDEFVREALLSAATFLTWKGDIEGGRMQTFLVRFYEDRLAEDEDYAWIGWLEAVALLGLRHLAPLVYSAWDKGLIPDRVLERHHFNEDLLEAERTPGDHDRFKRANCGCIDDVLESLEWTRHWEDVEPSGSPPVLQDPWCPATPYVNPWRDVGRNDPCPCGSGKKAKKCCLANG